MVFIMFSCEKQEEVIQTRTETFIGICRIYTGNKHHITHYLELENGKRKELTLTNGNKYIGKRLSITVIYESDGIHFRISNMRLLGDKENIVNYNKEQKNTNEQAEHEQAIKAENNHISAIRESLKDTDTQLYEIVTDLPKAKRYCEEKKKELPYLQTSYRADEKKRISEMAQESRENIRIALTRIEKTREQKAAVDSIRWVTDRKASFLQEVDTTINTLRSKYLDTIYSFKEYFDNLN